MDILLQQFQKPEVPLKDIFDFVDNTTENLEQTFQSIGQGEVPPPLTIPEEPKNIDYWKQKISCLKSYYDVLLKMEYFVDKIDSTGTLSKEKEDQALQDDRALQLRDLKEKLYLAYGEYKTMERIFKTSLYSQMVSRITFRPLNKLTKKEHEIHKLLIKRDQKVIVNIRQRKKLKVIISLRAKLNKKFIDMREKNQKLYNTFTNKQTNKSGGAHISKIENKIRRIHNEFVQRKYVLQALLYQFLPDSSIEPYVSLLHLLGDEKLHSVEEYKIDPKLIESSTEKSLENK